VTKEKLWEIAVSLVAANISAGQFNDGMHFGKTIIYEDTQTACGPVGKALGRVFRGR